MAILTKSGRAAIAAAIKSQPLYLALGAGSPHWDTQFETTVTLEPDIPVALYAPVDEISITAPDGALWVRDQDYRLDAAAGRLTWLGSAGEDADASAAITATATVTVRYRTGRASEETGAQALMAEIGRRLVEERHFVEPDPEGEIVVPTGRFRVVAGPSNHLFLRVRFDFEDAAGTTVREQALFVGTELVPELPPGQRYVPPEAVMDPGILLVLQHAAPIVRHAATRETFEFVVTF